MLHIVTECNNMILKDKKNQTDVIRISKTTKRKLMKQAENNGRSLTKEADRVIERGLAQTA